MLKVVLIFVALFLNTGCIVCTNPACAAEPKGKSSMSSGETSVMQYQGREMRLYTPASLPTYEKVPMLVVLHGGMGNAEGIEKSLGMNEIADKKGFVVAYLNGTGGLLPKMRDKRTWNAGDCCGIAVRQNVDDIGYISGFIKDMITKNPVDPARVYLMGHSNGAMMSYRFVCEKSDMVAAMVSVAGTMPINSCSGLSGLPVMEIHGAADQNIPVKGGVGGKSITKVNYRSVEQSKNIMQQGGALFTAQIIPSGGHNIGELSKAVQKSHSMTLAEMVEQFLSGKKK